MTEQSIRSFIAIELPDGLLKRIAAFQTGLKSSGQKFIKWVDPKHIHLTLKFLGNVDTQLLEGVKLELKSSVAKHHVFRLETGTTGCFPNTKRARVYWLGLQGDTAAMVVLQRSVDGAMAKLGFEAERKPFAGHLTLARLREVCTADDYLRFARLIESAVGLPALPFEVNHVELMRSQLTPNGPVYSKLARFPLHRQEHMGGLHASDV